MGGDDQMNPIEGETNTQLEGYVHDTKTEIEADKEASTFEVSEAKIEQAIENLKQEDSQRIDMDKEKGLFNSEVNVIKFKAYELSHNVKEFFKSMTWSKAAKLGSTAALGFILVSCSAKSVKASAPIEPVEEVPAVEVLNSSEEKTEDIKEKVEESREAPESELSEKEIREQRIDKIIEVVEANPNTFTEGEITMYLQEHGVNWTRGVQDLIDYYKGSNLPFKYFFVKNNYKESGVLLSPCPYQYSTERTMDDKNPLPTPVVVNEEMLGKMTESIYVDLWLKENGKYTGYFVEREGGYTTIIYMTQEIGEDGKPYDVMFLDIGGFFFQDADGRVKYISLDKIVNKQLTDEEMAFFTDTVLTGIKEGWVMFVTKEDGGLEKRGNFGEFKELLRPSISSDTVAQEIN